MIDARHVIGVDVGGTHVTAALIDLHQKKIVSSTRCRADIDTNGKAGDIIAAWSDCILSAKQNNTIAGVCLAMPGPFDYETGISLMQGQHKYESLYRLNIKELLAASLQLHPSAIFMDNDAACFLHGEVFGSTASEHINDTVIGITLGTGLGAAVYQKGSAQNAGLWCLPFKDGIAEDYLSTRWFLQRYEALTGNSVKGVKELAQVATTNETARAVFNEFGTQLAQFLLAFVKKENPQVIVIGGNIANAFPLFVEPLKVISEQHHHIKMIRSALGEDAPLLGAAGSWIYHQRQPVSIT
jgi:glucokinase